MSRAGVATSAADPGRSIGAFFCRRDWAMASLMDDFVDGPFAGALLDDDGAAYQSSGNGFAASRRTRSCFVLSSLERILYRPKVSK